MYNGYCTKKLITAKLHMSTTYYRLNNQFLRNKIFLEISTISKYSTGHIYVSSHHNLETNSK